MNWLKALGALVPLGIVAITLGGLVGLATGLASPPATVGVTAAGATIAFVLVGLVALGVAGSRWGGWVSTPYW